MGKTQIFNHYHLISKIHNRIFYYLSIDNSLKNHEERKLKKLKEIAKRDSIPENTMLWIEVETPHA